MYIQDLKINVWAHMLPNTVAVLSLGLLVDDLGFSYHCTPKQKPYLEKGKVRVTCHPSNNVPFIYPGVSSEELSAAASGDRALWEEVGEQEEDGPVEDSEKAKTSSQPAGREAELDEEDVPRVRCRP